MMAPSPSMASPLPLFGVCEILEKKKISEVSYSCQAAN